MAGKLLNFHTVKHPSSKFPISRPRSVAHFLSILKGKDPLQKIRSKTITFGVAECCDFWQSCAKKAMVKGFFAYELSSYR